MNLTKMACYSSYESYKKEEKDTAVRMGDCVSARIKRNINDIRHNSPVSIRRHPIRDTRPHSSSD